VPACNLRDADLNYGAPPDPRRRTAGGRTARGCWRQTRRRYGSSGANDDWWSKF